MHRLVRIGIVAAVAICLGTAALAVAENSRYPSAKQIPTVVTGPTRRRGCLGSRARNRGTAIGRGAGTADHGDRSAKPGCCDDR